MSLDHSGSPDAQTISRRRPRYAPHRSRRPKMVIRPRKAGPPNWCSNAFACNNSHSPSNIFQGKTPAADAMSRFNAFDGDDTKKPIDVEGPVLDIEDDVNPSKLSDHDVVIPDTYKGSTQTHETRLTNKNVPDAWNKLLMALHGWLCRRLRPVLPLLCQIQRPTPQEATKN